MAETVIRHWGTAPSSAYFIDEVADVITITSGSTGLFKFEAYDNVTGNPGIINAIESDADGQIALVIAGDPSHPGGNSLFGALDVQRIDFSTAENSRLVYVNIQRNLGATSSGGFISSRFAGPVSGFSPSGIFVGQDIIGASGGVFIGTSAADIEVGGNCASMSLGNAGGMTGNIIVHGSGENAIEVNCASGYSQQISVVGTLHGTINIPGALTGSIEVGGDLIARLNLGSISATGSVVVGGNVVDTASNGIQVGQFNGGYFECGDMDLLYNASSNPWPAVFLIGTENTRTYAHTGTIKVRNTLHGSIVCLAGSRIHFDIGTIDAGTQPALTYIEDGGLYAKSGFRAAGSGQPESLIEIGTFVGGKIQTGGHDPGQNVPTEHAGTIEITGNMGGVTGKSARIISQYVWTAEPNDPSINFDAKVNIGGSLYGTESGQPAIKANGNLNGHIFVNGSLRNYDSSAGGDEIAIRGSVAAGSAVAIDYAGYDADNEWQSGAVIRVGSTSYTTNTPGQRLYRISRCRGDMNNDDVIDSSDDTPFGLTFAAYSAAWPGLDGSWSYHRDANQDGVTGTGAPNPADAAAFLQLRNSQCCIPVCNSSASECPGDVNADGAVNLADLALVLASFGGPPPATTPCVDLDQDGLVDLSDLADVNANFGTVCDCTPPGLWGGGGNATSGEDCLEPGFVAWVRQASPEELFDWYSGWDGDLCPGENE